MTTPAAQRLLDARPGMGVTATLSGPGTVATNFGEA